MNETSIQILNRHFREAAQELLEHYNVEFGDLDPESGRIELVATLGFASEDIAGAIALCTSSRCAKYLIGTISAKNEQDWLAELANQLLGRIKRRLANHGVTFSVGVPVLLTGEKIEMAYAMDWSRSMHLAFQTPQGTLQAWFDFRTSPGVELRPEPMKNDAPSEGEILLF